MTDFDWRSFVKKVAPFIGTALGGPLGGAAASALAGALGGDPTKTTDQQLAAMVQNVTPEQLLALKNAENDFALKMQALGFQHETDLLQTAATDRASARTREIAVKDWTPKVLAYGVTAGFFGLLFWLMRHEVPAPSKDILNVMLGSLGTAWISVVTYYFGSSAGSQRKDELLQQSVPAPGVE
jgi:hypothetical protein